MGKAEWSDDFLDKMRHKADHEFDAAIKVILDLAFLHEDHRRIFTDWSERQSEQIAETTRFVDDVPEQGELAQATIERIDRLHVDQRRQYDHLGKWRSHIWSEGFQFHIDSTRLATLIACKALANRQPRNALAAMNCALTNASVLVKSFDDLAARVAAEPKLKEEIRTDNLAAYNRFLQLAENVRESPDLFLCDDAFRKVQFQSYPEILRHSYTPGQCPSWVDEEKLKTGFALWHEHMVGCVLVLFANSLPACYLDWRGIPLLYRSERLLKQEYLAQRVYETGFFLKDVMDEGGLKIIEDRGAMHTAWFAAAVHKIRPDLTFELGRCLEPCWSDAEGSSYSYRKLLGDRGIQQEFWAQQQMFEEGRGAVSGDYSASDLGCGSFERLMRDVLRHEVDFRGRRLWGRGFLTAHKVRYIHASMRYMALHGPSPHEVKEHGLPVNQEDMAYVLLTIGYVIPAGLEKLGAVLRRGEKEAFLHCWKVVGHVMGVDEDLLTDDWDDAKLLYEKIKSRTRGTSEKGTRLNNALCTLITDLLPSWLPMRSAVAPVWIRDQLGDDADLVFDAANKAASRNPVVSTCWAFVKHALLRPYFLSRYWFFDRIPSLRAFIDSQVQFMGNSMIECLKQTYERQRFDLFAHEQGIAANPNITEAEHHKRAAVRDRVFTWAAVGVIFILLFPIFGGIGIASLVVSFFSSAAWLGVVVKSMFWLCVIDVLGVSFVESKLKRCLKELAFKVPSKFLI
ncbi:MAG: oxygenase MpaB family protein [Burkholderiales bacterium]